MSAKNTAAALEVSREHPSSAPKPPRDDRSGIDIEKDSSRRYRSSVEKVDRLKERDIERALRST
jgi:hypothetical protein